MRRAGARGAAALALAALLAPGVGAAQPAVGGADGDEGTPAPRERRTRDHGFIGREIPDLEIDDCPPPASALDLAGRRALASEHYARGETLYVQGDYDGAVTELVAAYCVLPTYVVLKDIGQAYERSLEYEKAIAYLERYAAAIGPDARRANACAPDPQDDKANVERRVAVLQALPARVQVETTPAGATITLANDAGRAARARAGDQIELPGGRYALTIERDGYQPVTRTIEVRIGKPYTFFAQLQPLEGVLAIQVSPPDARVFLGDRLVGLGRFEDALPGGRYTIAAEAPGRVRVEKTIEVLPDRRLRETLELQPLPQTGRRQLIVAAAIGGGVGTGTLLAGFQGGGAIALGALVGSGAALAGAYLALPDDLALGTSNLTITTGLTGAIAGTSAAAVFTGRTDITVPMLGAGLLVGAAGGFWVGERWGVTPGQAAVVNSAVLWGTTTGALFASSFDPDRRIAAGLVLSGLGMGVVGGGLLARSFPTISRAHALLIDLGGLAGVVAGLATESIAYPADGAVADGAEARATPREIHFALGGMAIGLVAAGILTRNMDEPKRLPVRPAVGAAPTQGGGAATTIGVAGAW